MAEVKAPTKPQEKLRLPEVQEAMKSPIDSKAWMTEDFLKKISSNPKLLKAMTDPRFSAALELMQKDPKKAIKEYGQNAEFVEIMTEFSKLMGA